VSWTNCHPSAPSGNAPTWQYLLLPAATDPRERHTPSHGSDLAVKIVAAVEVTTLKEKTLA
jgi:hypothetical protein